MAEKGDKAREETEGKGELQLLPTDENLQGDIHIPYFHLP